MQPSSAPLTLSLISFYQADNPERANACTTAFFEGSAAIMDPRESWAAKWIRVDNYLPGVYAISVTGKLDKEIEDDLESRGIRWRCRPGST
jgi:transcription elongation factor SPT4